MIFTFNIASVILKLISIHDMNLLNKIVFKFQSFIQYAKVEPSKTNFAIDCNGYPAPCLYFYVDWPTKCLSWKNSPWKTQPTQFNISIFKCQNF